MITSSRRAFLALGVAAPLLPRALRATPVSPDRIADDLSRYIGFGIKASGGTGDVATGEWLEAELEAAGFEVSRQDFEAPWFDATQATLEVDTLTAAVTPQAVVVQGTVRGPLVHVRPCRVPETLRGAVALIELPFRRWSTATAKTVLDMVGAVGAAGAAGIVIVTTGPTGEAISLNVPPDGKLFGQPTAILAPNDADPFLRAAARQASATLTISGNGGRRSAFNVVGRIDRAADRWLVVTTPRSGWFTCAGERGPGIATWLALARWAAARLRGCNLLFAANSGHEYENFGSERLLESVAPPPSKTALWLHLGANLAARDWHDVLAPIRPLASADSQRYLVVSPALLANARAAFAGLCGLESPYSTVEGAAGEILNILAAGYPRVAAIFGVHRYHHTRDDDARTVDAALVEPVISSCRRLIEAV